jgi:hypothetical protein
LAPPGDESIADLRAYVTGLSDADVSFLYGQHQQLLHVFEGLELRVDEVLELQGGLPNPFGGPDLPAKVTLELVELVDADGCVAVEMRTVPDAEQALPIIMESARTSFGGAELTDEERQRDEAMAAEFRIETVATGQYDVATGSFVRVASTQRVSGGGEERVETVTITDVTATR